VFSCALSPPGGLSCYHLILIEFHDDTFKLLLFSCVNSSFRGNPFSLEIL
jgi:hypothetical protein